MRPVGDSLDKVNFSLQSAAQADYPETRARVLDAVEEWYWENWSFSHLLGYHLKHHEDDAFRSLKHILFPNGGGDVS
jgi:hypothetical protein